ncbi:MAG: Hsp70 family protein [Pirellulaceae bacterium]|nr:Hsp70 family protein [Pirellulaceae bacterium]
MPNETTNQPPIGIDLGTTYSVVAFIDDTGRPVTVPNSSGDLLTASALLFEADDVVVGREAVRGSVMDPDSFAECFKRDVGGSVYHRKVRGVDVPPEVFSAFVLERLRHDAERRLGPIRQAVITVPAFFDETRRKATQDAGRLAGLKVLDIINEPTAAAVAHGHQQGFFRPTQGTMETEPRRVLVYDLGGGTFDVTILEISGLRFRALATDGDVRLGGKDFDERLADYVAGQFAAEHGVDPRSDAQDAAQLWQDVQEAKHALSERQRATVMVFHAGIRMRIEVTRQLFEEVTRDLLRRTENTTALVVREAGLQWSDIDRVLLVGGSSRMPMVAEMLRRVTGKEPDRSASPDEAVAHGAALYAAMLMNRGSSTSLSSCELLNVNSHSLGVVGMNTKTRRRQNVVIIPKNTPIPCSAARTFQTARDGQRSVVVAVVEGESHRPEECISLGHCVVRDLPPDLPRGTQVRVEYQYAANGRISVLARVPAVRQSAQVELQHAQRRDLEDLDTWRARLRGTAGLGDGRSSSGGSVDLNDRTSVLRRLDALYTLVGKAALAEKLPAGLSGSQQAAQAAAASLEQAQSALHAATEAKESAAGTGEAVRYGSALARAKTAHDQALTQSDFAHLVLGRECVAASVDLPILHQIGQEIALLKQHKQRQPG